MYRFHRAATPLAFAAAMLTACAETPTDVAVSGADLIANTSSVEQSANDGAVIVRLSTIEFLIVFDADKQLLSVHMPSNVCSTGAFNGVELAQVITPSATDEKVSRVYSGDVQISVYSAASPAEAGFVGSLNSLGFANFVSFPQLCGFLAGPNRIAEGTARRSSTASNASYQLNATGTLQGVDGRDYQFTEVYQITADAHDPSNPATFAEHVAMINLRPIG